MCSPISLGGCKGVRVRCIDGERGADLELQGDNGGETGVRDGKTQKRWDVEQVSAERRLQRRAAARSSGETAVFAIQNTNSHEDGG